MPPAPTIHVVGELMIDVIARVHTAPAPGSDAPATITESDGGSAANVAAWLAHLDASVRFVARVGADASGDAALRRLSAAGVDVKAARDRLHPTGRCVVVVTLDGERTMFPDPGANAHLSATDIDPTDWQAGEHLHMSGYSLIREGSRAAALQAMERARLVGLTVSIDASSEAPLLAVGPETFLGWLAPTDVLFANAAEARALTGTADAARAVDALVMRGLTAVVKVGGDGALAGSREGRWRAPASPAIAQDSTGAGDAFAAGFLACWTRNGDMEAALDSATRTAARAVSRPGGRP